MLSLEGLRPPSAFVFCCRRLAVLCFTKLGKDVRRTWAREITSSEEGEKEQIKWKWQALKKSPRQLCGFNILDRPPQLSRPPDPRAWHTHLLLQGAFPPRKIIPGRGAHGPLSLRSCENPLCVKKPPFSFYCLTHFYGKTLGIMRFPHLHGTP